MPFQTTTRVTENTYRLAEPIGILAPQFGVKTVNMYLVVGTERAALIDSGMGIGNLREEIRQLTALPVIVLNTHYHWDHTGANAQFDDIALNEIELDLYAPEPEMSAYRRAMESPDVRAALPRDFDPATYRIIRQPITRKLCDGDVIDLGARSLRAIHTPGHSPGHTAFFDEARGALFTADTAIRGPNYACFPGSDPRAYAQSVRALSELRGVKTILPGHDEVVTDSNFLRALADAADAGLRGDARIAQRNEMFKRQQFDFGAFSIWFPM
ncbi:MAG: MBL fold metallo-hydrolase [Chloroflexi bacterium]|nr:MBL fold metallo-hydrolase [Chloroflexota bacterium]